MKHCAVVVALMLPLPALATDYLGKVTSVVDGDTFTMESDSGKVRVRICGIDAPERGQPGYGQAAGVLANMIEGKIVHCLQVGEGTVCDGRSKPNNRDRVVAQKLYRQARPRGLRLAEVLGRPLQDQRRDLFPEIGVVIWKVACSVRRLADAGCRWFLD